MMTLTHHHNSDYMLLSICNNIERSLSHYSETSYKLQLVYWVSCSEAGQCFPVNIMWYKKYYRLHPQNRPSSLRCNRSELGWIQASWSKVKMTSFYYPLSAASSTYWRCKNEVRSYTEVTQTSSRSGENTAVTKILQLVIIIKIKLEVNKKKVKYKIYEFKKVQLWAIKKRQNINWSVQDTCTVGCA